MVTTVTDNSPQSINTSLFSLDKDIQEIKKVTDKLSGVNPESNVISVNGKQGIVELTASDVKALPDTTVIPTTTSELENTSGFITINDVGSSFVPVTRKVNNKALSSDITLTASDVGALPDTTVIPTTTSELENTSGFITSSDSITGNAATATKAETADSANALAHRDIIQNTDTFQPIMNNDGKWIITDLYPGWKGSLYTLYARGSMSGLMFRIKGGQGGANQVQVNYSIDSNRFGMNWATLINSENIENYLGPLKSRISALESKVQ